MLTLIVVKGMVYGGLLFPCIGCHVPDVCFDYFIDVYQILEVTETL